MTRTDGRKTPDHSHTLSQVDTALAAKATLEHPHPDIDVRLDAIEKDAAVTKALLLAAIEGGSFHPPEPTVPGAPTGVSATAGDTSAAVAWTAPASNGGAAITDYEVAPYVGAAAQTPVTTGSAATSKTVTGLTNGTAYTFKVAAINSVGTGAQSAASSAVTVGGGNSRMASSIADIKALLLDDTVDEIVVANGTYQVSPASNQSAGSLWIGSAYAGRTRPIIVRPETPLGVKFDGRGATYFGGLSFEAGVHDMTWGAFEFINGNPTSTGVVVFGGYASAGPGVQRITIDGMKFGPSIVGRYDGNQSTGISPQDHAVYPSWSPIIGPTDISLLNLIVDQPLDGRYPLYSAVNVGHPEEYNANRMTIRGLRQTGAAVGVVLWSASDPSNPIQNVLIEDAVISGYKYTGIRLEPQFAAITLRDVTTTKDPRYSGVGFYSSLGNPPAGVTFDSCVFG